MKKYLIVISIILSSVIGLGQSQIIITTQAQLNTLQYYPVIYPTVIVTTLSGQDSSTMVTDLSPLSLVDSLYTGLVLDNTALTSLEGLNGLEFASDITIKDNKLLVDGSGLNGPNLVGAIYIYDNINLKTITNFSEFGWIDILLIQNNNQLENLNISFDNFVFDEVFYDKTSSIRINSNESLKSVRVDDPGNYVRTCYIDSNQSLSTVHFGMFNDTLGAMKIVNNPSLIKISGFQNLDRINQVKIEKNTSLSELCFIKQAFNRDGVGPLRRFTDNAPGANSEAEILATDCSDFNTGINELSYNELLIYPNPAHDEVFVSVLEKITTYIIYDVSGKVVLQGNVETNGRIGLSAISNGMYVLLVGDKRSKLIVR